MGGSCGIHGVEVHLVSLKCTEVVNLAAPAEEFDKDGGFESVAEVAPSNAFVDRDEARIDGISLAWVDHPPALRCREQRGGVDEESVFEVGEESMEAILGNG
jgi:hypothetical protein